MADLRKIELPVLVAQYADAALANRRAIDAGDRKTANRHHEVLASIYREIRGRGRDAQLALLPLLQHSEPGVRAWAAAHALDFSPVEGEPVLSELAKLPKALGISATTTLSEWKAGRLRFP